MNYLEDKRIVMTLDAGGTNLVFSAIRGGIEITEPKTFPTCGNDITACLKNISNGFQQIKAALPEAPAAISFAFPGPADYPAGIIGDLPNMPAFRGGIALGPFLQDIFKIPTFINNDGDLFAYGEALTGALPDLNKKLEKAQSIKRYKNLIGITLGTGFGSGIVLDGRLLIGDNASSGDVWCFRNKKHPQLIAEESVSIRAIKRIYREQSKDSSEHSPKEIYEIAKGFRQGNSNAARESFSKMGEVAGDVIASVATLIDGIVVIGGGLAGASEYILPAMLNEMNSSLSMIDGSSFPRMQVKAFNLENEEEFKQFAHDETIKINIPGTSRSIDYDPFKRIGVITSKQGANRSISLGAYFYALHHL